MNEGKMSKLQFLRRCLDQTRTTFLSCLALSLFLLFAVTESSVQAQSPPVRYRLTWLANAIWNLNSGVFVNDMNDAGFVVGSAKDATLVNSRAFVYSNGFLINLNTPNVQWTDQGTTVNGWTAISASGINNIGQIVGTAKNSAGQSRAFVALDALRTAPQFMLLPSVSGASATEGRRINDRGVVIGYASSGWVAYMPSNNGYSAAVPLGFIGDSVRGDINNAGVIVNAGGYVMSPNPNFTYTTGAFQLIANRQFFRINELSTMSGVRKTGKTFGQQFVGPILRSYTGLETLLATSNASDYDIATGLNDSNDVVFCKANRGFLTHSDYGTYALDQLLINPSADWSAGKHIPWGHNNRLFNGFGQIIGRAEVPATTSRGQARYVSYILTPE